MRSVIHLNSTQNSLFQTSMQTQNCFNNVKHCKLGQEEKAVPCVIYCRSTNCIHGLQEFYERNSVPLSEYFLFNISKCISASQCKVMTCFLHLFMAEKYAVLFQIKALLIPRALHLHYDSTTKLHCDGFIEK